MTNKHTANKYKTKEICSQPKRKQVETFRWKIQTIQTLTSCASANVNTMVLTIELYVLYAQFIANLSHVTCTLITYSVLGACSFCSKSSAWPNESFRKTYISQYLYSVASHFSCSPIPTILRRTYANNIIMQIVHIVLHFGKYRSAKPKHVNATNFKTISIFLWIYLIQWTFY